MKGLCKMLKEKIKQIRLGKLSVVENIKGYLDKISKDNKDLNCILVVNDKALEEAKKLDTRIKSGEKVGKLAGLGFVVKSNINVKGLKVNCASKTLEDYNGTYDASVIEKLLAEDAIVLGMANMDEFASGGSGETSGFGVCKNPVAKDRIPGGSSSGSASAVAGDLCDFSLGSDTGGSIRNPASHCGVVGMKPSYGSVSRYGLIDLSMSLDVIGPLGKSVEDVELVYDIIKGKDKNDATSWGEGGNNRVVKGVKNAVKIGILNFNAEDKIWEKVLEQIEVVKREFSFKSEKVKLNYVELGIQTYYPIVYTEFFSGTRKFDGRKYGKKIEESCGEEVLRRILGGGEISKAEYGGRYYRKALQAKKLIEKEFEKAFKKFDVIICPTVPKLPHKLGEKISIEDMYDYDAMTVLANLAEVPAISIPCGEVDGIPVGMQLICPRGKDNFMLELGKRFEG